MPLRGEDSQSSEPRPLGYFAVRRRAGVRSKLLSIARRGLALTLFSAFLITMFVLGRRSASRQGQWDPRPVYGADISSEGAIHQQSLRFSKLVFDWAASVRQADGYLLEDPYTFAERTGCMNGRGELRFFDVERPLPPRLNRELRRNPHLRVFAWERPDLDEVWECYADGTWARVSAKRAGFLGSGWYGLLKSAGFPVSSWEFHGDRKMWIEQNRDRLVWDESRRMYVVHSIPATRP